MATVQQATVRDDEIDPDPPPLNTLPALPPIGRAARLYADVRTHRAVPLPVGLALTKARSEWFWRRNAGGRAAAIKAMDFLLGKSSRAHEVEDIAKRHVWETAKRSELLWRPQVTRNLPVDGAHILHELYDQGRGSLLHFWHHGPYVGLTASLSRAGVRGINAPIAPFYFEEPTPGYLGHRDRQHLSCLYDGARCFSADGSFPRLLHLLERGQVVGVGTDTPGRCPVEVLGRTVLTSAGTSKLALKTGAPIVPVTLHPEGDLARVRVNEPIEPSEFGDVQALQQEIVRRMEPSILAWPEALEWPLQRWTAADAGQAT